MKTKNEPIYISVEKSYFGYPVLSTVYKSQRIERKYTGYSEATAKAMFKAHLKTL